MINFEDAIGFIDKVCSTLEDKSRFSNSMAELSAVFGSELINKVSFLLSPENAAFFAITSEEGDPNFFIYGVREYFGDYEEYYYLKSSLLCFCETTEILFYKEEMPICHHSIALKIAVKLGIVKNGKLPTAIILQCMKNRANCVAKEPFLDKLSF